MTKNFRYMRCVRFDRWRGATKEHSRQRSVTEEQRSYRSNLAQPSGLPSFSPLPALLAPHRPLAGMLCARAEAPRALAAAKNPGNACIENSLSRYYFRVLLSCIQNTSRLFLPNRFLLFTRSRSFRGSSFGMVRGSRHFLISA